MKIQLHQGDCIEVLDQLNTQRGTGWANLTVTSPPYNLGIKYGKKVDDRKPEADYVQFTRKWLGGVATALAPEGSLFINVGSAPSAPGRPFQVIATALKEGWILQNTFHWIKSISIEKKDGSIESCGHFKPINSSRYVNDAHEYIFHLTRCGKVPLKRKAPGLGVPYQDKSNLSRWSHTESVDSRCRGNNWYIPYETIQSRAGQRPHPASFPPRLPEMCILLHGQARHTRLLDPFLGIGNTGIAGQRQHISEFTGIELETDYLDYARERLEIR